MKEVSRTELEAVIDQWIMNSRNRRIAKRKLIDGIRFEELAEEFDLSVRWVKEIVRAARMTIERHI